MMFLEDKIRRQLDIFLDSIALGISFFKSFLWLNSLQNIPQADELEGAEIWSRKCIWKCLPPPSFFLSLVFPPPLFHCSPVNYSLLSLLLRSLPPSPSSHTPILTPPPSFSWTDLVYWAGRQFGHLHRWMALLRLSWKLGHILDLGEFRGKKWLHWGFLSIKWNTHISMLLLSFQERAVSRQGLTLKRAPFRLEVA